MRDTEKTDFARRLRKGLTDAEQKLWHSLRNRSLRGLKFHRQYVIGPYIVDFCCLEKRLIIELDGGQHAEPRNADYDKERTNYFKQKGYRELRFWDMEVLKETQHVLEVIWETVDNPHPNPLPLKGEGDQGKCEI